MERFWSKVDTSGDCWVWTAATSKTGYGRFGSGGKTGAAHRFAYELLVGPIPAGLQIDHLCRNRACVNPDHLEPVTQKENLLRGVGAPAHHARKTQCVNGHEFDEANTSRSGGSRRRCRTCERAARLRYKARVAA